MRFGILFAQFLSITSPARAFAVWLVPRTLHYEEETMSEKVPGEKPGLLIHYTLDGEIQSTTLEMMTPREILSEAGFDPKSYTLIEVEGDLRQALFDLDRPIPIRAHMKFAIAPARVKNGIQ
jgi:hypothetical protein